MERSEGSGSSGGGATRPLTARYTEAEIAAFERLIDQYPELGSVNQLMRHAALIGQLVMAAGALRPGPLQYGGHDPADLAAHLARHLAPAWPLLVQHQHLAHLLPPVLLTLASGTAPVPPVPSDAPAPPVAMPSRFDPLAADDIASLGIDEI
jgi:hypothetical protein